MKNANPVSAGRGWALLFIGTALLIGGCGRGGGGPAAASRKTVFDRFEISVGGRPASLHVAVLDPEKERGLMQRPDLAGDEGMVFVDPKPTRLAIWMRNTPEPLDLGYLAADGTLREVYGLLPYDERGVYSNAGDVQFALEMRRGWFAEHGVRPGARMDMAALAAALRERGFTPGDFGIR